MIYEFANSVVNYVDPSGLIFGINIDIGDIIEDIGDTGRGIVRDVVDAIDDPFREAFIESSWSQTVRENPIAAIGIGAGAALLAIGLGAGAVGAAAAGTVLGGAIGGGAAGAASGTVYGSSIYEIAASGQCGCETQLQALSTGKGAFVARVREQAALYGVLYGGLSGAGPVGRYAAGVGGAIQGGQAIDIAFQDMDIRNSGTTPCNTINTLLGLAGVLGGASLARSNVSPAASVLRRGTAHLIHSNIGNLSRIPGIERGHIRQITLQILTEEARVNFANNPEIASRIPASWGPGRPERQGGGWRWQDPSNPNIGVRIDVGRPSVTQSYQQVDHVVVTTRRLYAGRWRWGFLDPNGNILPGNPSQYPQAHIPLDVWLQWRTWDSP